MVDDALAHRETGRIPHMILCDPTIGRALADRRGVADVETILSNAVAWIGDRLPGARRPSGGPRLRRLRGRYPRRRVRPPAAA